MNISLQNVLIVVISVTFFFFDEHIKFGGKNCVPFFRINFSVN